MKVSRLSEKKIHIICDMNIFCSSVPEVLIDTFSSRFVYKKIKSHYVDGTPIEAYYANIKPGNWKFSRGRCGRREGKCSIL